MENTKPVQMILEEVGEQVARYRVSRNLRQSDVARKAGLSLPTISRFEGGEGATLETLIRVLRALELENRIYDLVPEAKLSPLDSSADTNLPKRARRVKSDAQKSRSKPWQWGE